MNDQATAAAGGVHDVVDEQHEASRRTTSVYLTVTMLDRLDAIGRKRRLSRTWLIEEAVREWLEKQDE